jgi:LAS superfamily LD-carboxypeptidase LdcB
MIVSMFRHGSDQKTLDDYGFDLRTPKQRDFEARLISEEQWHWSFR